MNTSQLKRFAQAARTKLIEQVAAKLNYVLTHDTSEFRGKADTINKLNEEVKKSGKEALVEKVAYTWFNRLVALRFMDANGYQPIGYSVVSPAEVANSISPQILDEAHAGHIPADLPVDVQEVMNIINGNSKSGNPDNDAYRLLLVAACNHLSSIFPFLFERIDDYTELLLPDDLTSPFSIVKDVVEGMSVEDCREVEIIGWLYQFYISEKKDEVFALNSAIRKEDIPAATQLFTPRWIVEYMVQNTLGKLWLQNRPDSGIKQHMPYYIESPSSKSDDYLKVNSVHEIRLLDQACGSGHILVYAFDLFTKIYEEEGFNANEIPQLIIENNLFGFEIDERAAQLAGFALMMKARSYYRRFFRKENKTHILCFRDMTLKEEEIKSTFKELELALSDCLLHDLVIMQQATNFGSLIKPQTSVSYLQTIFVQLQVKEKQADLFTHPRIIELIAAIDQLIQLGKSYHCIVDNPPYMGGGNMNKDLSEFVKTNYPDSKADLMACFMEVGLKMLHPKGFLGMINQETWMFKTTYKQLREKFSKSSSFDCMLHLGTRVFKEINGDKVRSTSFVMLNSDSQNIGVYYKLTNYNSSESKRDAFLNKQCLKYIFDKNATRNITEFNWAYWLTENGGQIIKHAKPLNSIAEPKKGITTGQDDHYLKLWFEVEYNRIKFNQIAGEQLTHKWYPVNKGGGYRKWFGLLEYIIMWEDDGLELKNFRGSDGKLRSALRNLSYNFLEGVTWTSVSSSGLTCRYTKSGMLMTDNGATIFRSPNKFITLGLLNSNVGEYFLSVLTPGFKYDVGVINKFPIHKDLYIKKSDLVTQFSEGNVKIALNEWDSKLDSWDFKKNELIRLKAQDIEETYDSYQQYWKNKFFQLHRNEEELNRLFIEIYGLQDELTPDVPLEEITILKEETSIENGELVFHADEVFAQFVSYAVGCMFGRYSLDKKGLVLANQGETLEDYLRKVERSREELSFLPDEDNIIPVLDDEWFEDDITTRFQDFLKASFGEQYYRKNLQFVEESLGVKEIRKYFTKDFYKDHIRRYKKRPIYWMFSSPKGYFNVLVYLHRYTPDTMNRILNSYLKEFIEKLNLHRKQLEHIEATGSATEQNKARKEIDKIDIMVADCRQYETDILYPLASERIALDLDDGVLVNYNKMGKAVAEVTGLNDKAAKKKVKEFDWIDGSLIR